MLWRGLKPDWNPAAWMSSDWKIHRWWLTANKRARDRVSGSSGRTFLGLYFLITSSVRLALRRVWQLGIIHINSYDLTCTILNDLSKPEMARFRVGVSVGQGCPTLLLVIECPAKFSSNSNQKNTPALNFQVILETLISCFRCVWLKLELNFAGQTITRSRVGHPWCRPFV